MAQAVGAIVLSTLFLLLLLFVNGAQVWSCFDFTSAPSASQDSLVARVTSLDTGVAEHRAVYDELHRIWSTARPPQAPFALLMLRSQEVNAVSFGAGRFLVWEGVGQLPRLSIDAIAAHEVAHDILRHSKKASELQDLMDFFAEALSLFSGSDDPTRAVIRRWTRNMALPHYSRRQELQADSLAVELLRADGNADAVLAMTETLQLLRQQYGESGGGLFANHPSVTERVQALHRRAEAEVAGKVGRD
jgi:Zn-dependent protease with chaperone function